MPATTPSIAPFLSSLIHRARATPTEELILKRSTLYAQWLLFEGYNGGPKQLAWEHLLEPYMSSIHKVDADTYCINVLGLHYQLQDAGDFVEASPSSMLQAAHEDAGACKISNTSLGRFFSGLVNYPYGSCVVKVSSTALYRKFIKDQPAQATPTHSHCIRTRYARVCFKHQKVADVYRCLL